MLKRKLMEQLRNENHFIVPKYVFYYSKELGLDMNSLMLLIYFINNKNKEVFNYKKIISDLNLNEKELVDAISILKDHKLLSIEMIKNEQGILEEIINVETFYDVVFSKILNEKEKEEEKADLYSKFETEFGRTLSPMEVEIINGWKDSGVTDSIILAALKETVFNGVSNLRYVDKIIYEWKKKGIKNVSDISRHDKKESDSSDVDCYEYDWLNE